MARHFSKLLYQTGARAGYKFLQMTAGEALRIGSKTFAQRLESLTGGPKDVGPPPDSRPFRRGLHVEVRDPQHGPGDKAASWYVGPLREYAGLLSECLRGQESKSVQGARAWLEPRDLHWLLRNFRIGRYPGEVLRQDDKGNYVVRYTDKTEEDDVPENRIRAQATQAVGGVLFLDEACVDIALATIVLGVVLAVCQSRRVLAKLPRTHVCRLQV